MDSYLGTVPPVRKRSKELQTAVQDDIRRKQIDSAKKRAAAQNVDYESFAALVSMSHVKPFERKRGQQEESAKRIHALPAWSFDASGSICSSDYSFGQRIQKPGNRFCSIMTTAQERDSPVTIEKSSLGCVISKCMTADSFKREWRKLGKCFQEKLKFLLAVSADELPKIFKVELPPSILVDVIEVLYWWANSVVPGRMDGSFFSNSTPSDVEGTCTTGDVDDGEGCPQQSFDAKLALQMLKSMCACGRFSLSLKLSGTRAHHLANDLISRLMQNMERSSERADAMLCMLSDNNINKNNNDDDNTKVGNVLKDSRAHETESLGGQTLCLDELKHLASAFSCL